MCSFVWLTIHMDAHTQLRELLSLSPSDPLTLQSTVEVFLPSYYVSATFVLTLNTSKPSSTAVSLLSEMIPAVLGSSVLGGLPVAQSAPSGAQGFYQSGWFAD